MTRFYPCPFYFQVAGSSINGQASKPLAGAKRIAEAIFIFPAGTSLNLLYQFFFLSAAPTNFTALPSSNEMTVNEIVPGYYVGDAISYSIPFQYLISPSTPYLAMYATNRQAVTLSAQAIAILEADT